MNEKKTILKKTPRCVAVYNKLFDMIKNNEFSNIDKLPGELELSKIMKVSRSTLRQALELLQEDGIIKSVQGKGNFIIKKDIKMDKGLEVLANPIHSIIADKIDEIELEFKIEVGTDYTSQILEQKSSVVIFTDRWFKIKERIVAYTISVIPIESIVEDKIDLTNNKEELLTYLEEKVYKLAKSSTLKISYSEIGNISSTKYKISKNNKCHLIIETLYNKNNLPILFNKHYIPIEEGNLIIYRK